MNSFSDRVVATVDRGIRRLSPLNILVEKIVNRVVPTTVAVAGCIGSYCAKRCNYSTCREEYKQYVSPGTGCCGDWIVSVNFCSPC